MIIHQAVNKWRCSCEPPKIDDRSTIKWAETPWKKNDFIWKFPMANKPVVSNTGWGSSHRRAVVVINPHNAWEGNQFQSVNYIIYCSHIYSPLPALQRVKPHLLSHSSAADMANFHSVACGEGTRIWEQRSSPLKRTRFGITGNTALSTGH